jgi:hypothetical protein
MGFGGAGFGGTGSGGRGSGGTGRGRLLGMMTGGGGGSSMGMIRTSIGGAGVSGS